MYEERETTREQQATWQLMSRLEEWLAAEVGKMKASGKECSVGIVCQANLCVVARLLTRQLPDNTREEVFCELFRDLSKVAANYHYWMHKLGGGARGEDEQVPRPSLN